MQAAAICIITLCFCQSGFSVVRPDFSWHPKSPRLNPTAEVSATESTDAAFPSYITAQHCCKVGESLLRKVNTCSDANLRTNMLIKGKRQTLRQEVAKGLAVEVSRCQQHQHLLHKCCLFRLQYVIALEACDSKFLWERYTCRLGVRNRFGL